MNEKTPGQRIRDLREELGWSHHTLSQAADVSIDYLLQLEGGQVSHVSIRTWRKLAEALGYTVDDILDPAPEVQSVFEEVPDGYRWLARFIVALVILLGSLALISIVIGASWHIIVLLERKLL